eukprot:166885_1
MPSFSNANGNYHFYLNLPKNSQIDINTCEILWLFVKYMTFTVVCGLLMHSWHFTWDYFDANDYDTFMGDKYYFEFDIMLVIWQCTLIVVWCLVLASARYPYNTFYKMAIHPSKYKHEFGKFFFLIFLLSFICLIPIAYLTFWDENRGKQPVFKSTNNVCQWLLCKYIYVRFLLIYCVYPGILPLILWCSWYIYYLLKLQGTEPYDRNQRLMSEESGVTDVDNKLLDPNNSNVNLAENDTVSRQSSSNWSMKKLKSSGSLAHQRYDEGFKLKFPLLLLILWCFSFMISFLFGYIHGDAVDQYFEALYFTFSGYTVCFKFIMKQLARRCDHYRSEVSEYNYVFSIEYFMEFYWSLTYWMIYRFYTVFHAPTVSQFAMTLSAHLFWEFCAVIVRYHGLYYRKSNEIIIKYYTYLYLLHDGYDCTLSIWRDRLSMDLVVKLWCAVFSGLFFALDYKECFGMYSEQLDDHASSTLVVSYLSIATLVEFLFYCVTIQFGKLVLDYNIMFPFVYYCKRLTKAHVFIIVFIYGCVVIPVY